MQLFYSLILLFLLILEIKLAFFCRDSDYSLNVFA